MKFGLVYHSSLGHAAPRDESLQDLLTKAKMASRLGFSSFWVGGGPMRKGWHPVPTLARAAAEAPGLEFGTLALLSMQQPIEFAEQLASLDAICGGKFTLVAAQGWRDSQLKAFGLSPKDRLGRFLETLEVMKALWTQEKVTYHGKHFQLDDVPGTAPCGRKPHLKVLIAAEADRAVRRIPSIGEGWMVSARYTLPTIARQAALYREVCDAAGVKPHISVWRECFVAPTREEALAAGRKWAANPFAERIRLGQGGNPSDPDSVDKPFDALMKDRFIFGSPDDVAAEIARYRSAGADDMVLRMQVGAMPNDVAFASMRLFSEKVLPRVGT